MKIGNIELKTNVVLGPMAGITDMPFRALCMEQGASLTFTEMVSAKGLYYKNQNTHLLLEVGKDEHPVAVQLFGSDPEIMAGEAKKLEGGPFDFFDINMGCPMPKIVNNGEGSALMLDPLLAGKIVETMAKRLEKPVTVKFRKGFNDENINAVEFAKIMENSGAAAISVHGRTREQYYHGEADWDIIRQVKEAVKIPVIGSGDVECGADAVRMIKETGCDGVMIARAARGNPWIFREANACIKGEPVPERPALAEVKDTIRRQLDMMIEIAGELSAVRQMRKHVGYYCVGFPNSARLRNEINKSETAEEFNEILTKWTL